MHEICSGYYISGSLDWYSPIPRGCRALFPPPSPPHLPFHEPTNTSRRREDRKGEKERGKYAFIYLFIYLWPWYTRFNSSRKDLQGSYPALAVGIPPILYDHASEPILWEKKKKEGGKKREHPRRGEGLTNSTWLRPAIYSRFKGCAGEFYYSAAEFANLFNDLFAMTNSK